MKASNVKWWILWLLGSLALGGYYAYALMLGEDKGVFLPGETSHGHYQIELACDSCHGEAFGGGEALQDACVRCHGAELKAVDDSHPKSKFTDPRNADRVAILDARYCVTCHREHRPQITNAMAVTLPDDFCFHCHEDIAEDRQSHEGMAFDTCASAGCHNYHDNQALYEDFLVKHGAGADVAEAPHVPLRDYGDRYRRDAAVAVEPLTVSQIDAPSQFVTPENTAQWHETAHAQAGVNCRGCHQNADDKTQWLAKPGQVQCERCHDTEAEGFLAGKHGMRLAEALGPMSPTLARLPMKDDAHQLQLGCTSCHSSHRFDTRKAAAEACLGCHDDEHSRAYQASAHYRLWQHEAQGRIAQGRGVSCATCHMPRVHQRKGGETRVVVEHNQNLNLRPNEKMIRSVCLNCHSLAFSIDALADPELIDKGFAGKPGVHIESIEMALVREREKAEEKARENER